MVKFTNENIAREGLLTHLSVERRRHQDVELHVVDLLELGNNVVGILSLQGGSPDEDSV